jgi:pyrimidine-nucleoside phosphorylase
MKKTKATKVVKVTKAAKTKKTSKVKKAEQQFLDAPRIIAKKRDGKKLSKEEIRFFIEGLTSGAVPEYQMTALLMAIYLKGFDTEETAALTDAMLYSGKILSFNDDKIIDKHSTGGIGDKATFILAPIAAAAGVKVPSIAGRGLGFTGGTVDKIEAVKGFKTDIDLNRFQELLIKNGLVLIGQTGEFAPADKTIYSLRDVTSTVDSIPLITASIMSKKLAEGISGIVLDVKCGSGAFMKSKALAKKLALSLAGTAARFDKRCMALITDMSQPLGKTVGNSIEIIESIEALKGRGPTDLMDLSVNLAGAMIYLAGLAKNHKEGIATAWKMVHSGKALAKFELMLAAQGGDTKVINDYDLLPMATETFEVKSTQDGYVKSFINDEIGYQLTELGGGRKVASDLIDHGVGFTFHKKIGDKVKKGESLLTIHHRADQKDLVKAMAKRFTSEIIGFSKAKTKSPKLIYEIIKK